MIFWNSKDCVGFVEWKVNPYNGDLENTRDLQVLDVSDVFFSPSDLCMRHGQVVTLRALWCRILLWGVTEEILGDFNELGKPDVDGVLESKGVESVSGQSSGAYPLKSSHLVPSMKEFGWVEAKGCNVVVNEASTPLNDVVNKKIEPIVGNAWVGHNYADFAFSEVTYNLRRTWRKFDVGEMSLDEETGIWLFKFKSETGRVSYAMVFVEVNADRELPKGVEAKWGGFPITIIPVSHQCKPHQCVHCKGREMGEQNGGSQNVASSSHGGGATPSGEKSMIRQHQSVQKSVDKGKHVQGGLPSIGDGDDVLRDPDRAPNFMQVDGS
ncbi:hypothetical protein L6452_01308 [Arctium lappa]|uniref:Uncharacterized protein n=1 Tax=Arctium lappa TaxID=4217 RepID=A0ACB9FFR9_ARCLA|nr:hypothetical protein L6452_01308 [Arctium lappa]